MKLPSTEMGKAADEKLTVGDQELSFGHVEFEEVWCCKRMGRELPESYIRELSGGQGELGPGT